MKQILIPISPGELLDKITILEIKSERIESAEKKANVNNELSMLNKVWDDAVSEDSDIISMRKELKSINEASGTLKMIYVMRNVINVSLKNLLNLHVVFMLQMINVQMLKSVSIFTLNQILLKRSLIRITPSK